MTYQEAFECEVSVSEALYEIEQHGFRARVFEKDGKSYLMDFEGEPEIIAMIKTNGLVDGADVLGWLGY